MGETTAAIEYSKLVAKYVDCNSIPRPPETPEELLVIVDEYPQMLSAYLPLTLTDTPFKRALAELVAEIPDWV